MPNKLLKTQAPYDPSGWLMDEPQAVEVTLCNDPAVKGARFRVIRSAGSLEKPQGIKLQMPVRKKVAMKQQVMGYVSVPWLEDWYGDVMDPEAIEHAAHSMLKNLQAGNVLGNGVGEEHEAFWNNAHIIQSTVDYNGTIGGIPGGWWIAIQITDPTVWKHVMDGTYQGFSLGSMVRFVNTADASVKSEIFQRVPDMRSVDSKTPAKDKPGAFANPGDYGYPTEKSAYADPNNNKFPIDTRSRAYATLRYVLDNYDSEGYAIEELKYVVRRMLAAIVAHGDEVPAEVMQRVGFTTKQSVMDHAGDIGMKVQHTTPTPVEEEKNMSTNISPELLAAIQSIAQDTVESATKEQNAKLDKIVAALSAKTQSTEEKPEGEAPAADGKTEGEAPAADGKTEGEAKTQSAADIKALVLEVLKEQQATAKPVEETKTQTADDLKSVLSEFGKAIGQALATSQQSTAQALQAMSDRISEMPIPRATVMKTMSKEDKSSHLEAIKRKIEGGFDITAEEGRFAESFGVDFSANDPFAGVTL